MIETCLRYLSFACALQKPAVIAQVTLNLSTLHFTSLAQRQSAGLITRVSMDQNHQEVPNRRGAGVARGAHNPEDTGSKPVAGISNSPVL